MSYNDICEIEGLANLSKLYFFGCTHNEIIQIKELDNLKEISIICLEGNPIDLQKLRKNYDKTLTQKDNILA